MTNNDIIRRLRYTFDYSDDQMIELFKLGRTEVTRAQVSDWLKKDETVQVKLMDVELASFLNGMIVKNRGAKEGVVMENERQLNNNIIFRKLRIAMNFKDTDIIKVYDEVEMVISKHELSAIFRKPDQRQYKACLDQFLRNFLLGLQLRERGNKEVEIAE